MYIMHGYMLTHVKEITPSNRIKDGSHLALTINGGNSLV